MTCSRPGPKRPEWMWSSYPVPLPFWVAQGLLLAQLHVADGLHRRVRPVERRLGLVLLRIEGAELSAVRIRMDDHVLVLAVHEPHLGDVDGEHRLLVLVEAEGTP